MSYVEHISPLGEVFFSGGIYSRLGEFVRALHHVNFDSAHDILICTGNLLEHPRDDHETLSLLEEPWFHTVLGQRDWELLNQTGLTNPDTAPHIQRLSRLPLAIEVHFTDKVRIGVTHADCPVDDWHNLASYLDRPPTRRDIRLNRESFLRTAVGAPPRSIAHIDLVVTGHSQIGDQPFLRAGNEFWIDRGPQWDLLPFFSGRQLRGTVARLKQAGLSPVFNA